MVSCYPAGQPIVLAAVDWCEIRNDAYSRWRTVLAEAAATVPERVLVCSVHQHDAPVADLEAERILRAHKAKGSICDPEFHERPCRPWPAPSAPLKTAQRLTHIGIGQAKVEKVASNRRYLGSDGKPRFGRTSATRDAAVREQPEGIVDPWLKTLSFWDGDRPLVAVSCYATHPMSYYGKGGVSSDFMGLARKRRRADEPKVAQIYVSGCSGNVTAGKYNDGSPDNRPILAERMYQGMAAAWKATKRHPLNRIQFRSELMRLEPRDGRGFTKEDLTRRLDERSETIRAVPGRAGIELAQTRRCGTQDRRADARFWRRPVVAVTGRVLRRIPVARPALRRIPSW